MYCFWSHYYCVIGSSANRNCVSRLAGIRRIPNQMQEMLDPLNYIGLVLCVSAVEVIMSMGDNMRDIYLSSRDKNVVLNYGE
jgi:hypothetical protein